MVAVTSGRTYGKLSAEQRRSDRRQRLIKAGLDILADEGIAKITITAVCSRANLAKRYFYEGFSNREALLEAVFEEIASAGLMLARAMVGGSIPQDTGSRVRAVFEAGAAMLDAQPRLAESFTQADKGELVMRLRKGIISSLADYTDWFGLTTDRGEARSKVAGVAFAGAATELVTAWFDGEFDISRGEMIDHAVEVLATFGAQPDTQT